jgi:sialate O-acetylesterase
VTSSQVATPEYVRYAWPNAPDATLMDSGLPASTFTSEAVPTPPAH